MVISSFAIFADNARQEGWAIAPIRRQVRGRSDAEIPPAGKVLRVAETSHRPFVGPERPGATTTLGNAEDNMATDLNIAARLAQTAAECPGAIAIVRSGHEPVTYGELEQRSAALAARLSALGIGPGSYVAICTPRSVEAIIAIVAIVRAGAAYVPLDPDYPDAKLSEMLADTQPAAILSVPCARDRIERIAAEAASASRPAIWDLQDATSQISDAPGAGSPATPDSAAYVMFTSGSTGRPKGVVVPQRAILRLVVGQDYCELGPDEVILQLAPLNFDASTFEIWGALLNGGVLAIMPETQPTTAEIAAALEEHRVTTLWLTAGLFHLMVDTEIAALTGLRQMLAGGDVLSPDHVRRFQHAAPHARMINGYGPTENTTFTCCAALSRGPWPIASAPIGRPIAGTQVFIVDDMLRPVPDGEAGQLVTAGEGLAIGYLGNPQLTAERFVKAPAPIAQRIYLTGDLARRLPDGQFAFLGRMDRQIKIDGKRIEPGEIEVAMRACAGVQDAAIVVEQSAAGNRRLLGFVVASHAGLPAIEAEVQHRLPRHMWPSRLYAVDALPITPNGKIDRDALVMRAGESRRAVAAPADAAQETVAALWREALGIRQIGVDEAFFDLGGRSLQLMRVHKGLEAAFGRTIAVADLFARPTIRAMAKLGNADAPTVNRASLVHAQSRAQQRRAALSRRNRPLIEEAVR